MRKGTFRAFRYQRLQLYASISHHHISLLLVHRGSGKPIGPDRPEFYLLTPNTGETRIVTGEFAPLLQEGKRFLQATGKADEFWAAILDREKDQTQIGRYNLKSFSFTPVLTVPHINFDSMSMWVDEKHNKVYVAYHGQLISIPLQHL
jgi:hypothetical protein